MSVPQLKETRRGLVTGRVFPSARKALLFDDTDSIEVVLFGAVFLKPRTLYQISVDKLVLDGCIPVSHSNVQLISDESDEWKTCPQSKLIDSKTTLADHTLDFRIFVREKSNCIKHDSFHVGALLECSSVCDVIKVSICNIESLWFLYVNTGNYYDIELEKGILINNSTTVLDLQSVGHISVNKCENIVKIMDCPFFKRQDKLMTFCEVKAINNPLNSCLFVCVKCVIVSTKLYKTSGIVTCVDDNNDVENIGFTPAFKCLPKTFLPGTEIILSHLLLKKVSQNKLFITATKMTQITLIDLPKPALLSQKTSSLYDVQTTSQVGLLSFIVSVSCILSLSINTIHSISCKVCVCDSSGSATLHIKDNFPFVEELFQLTEHDKALLEHAKLNCGKVDADSTEILLMIFSRTLTVSVLVN